MPKSGKTKMRYPMLRIDPSDWPTSARIILLDSKVIKNIIAMEQQDNYMNTSKK